MLIMGVQNGGFYNYLTWFLQLSILSFQLIQIPDLIEKMDINGLVVNGIFLIAAGANSVFKLNLRLYHEQLAELVNQILFVNTCWGKYISTACSKSRSHPYR